MKKIEIIRPGAYRDGEVLTIPDGMHSLEIFNRLLDETIIFRPLLDMTGRVSVNDKGIERWSCKK